MNFTNDWIYRTVQKKLKQTQKDELWLIPKKILEYQSKEKIFFKPPETVEGFCFVISVTGLCRRNTGKGDGDVLVV
jgi:hypothetical protein